MVESRDSRSTAKSEYREKDRNIKYVVGGWLEYMTQRQKIVEPVRQKIIVFVRYVSHFYRT